MSIIPVPGSERFASRRRSRDDIAREIDPALAIFDIGSLPAAELDPLTYEVIRHRLWSITDMMGESLKRMSGSLAVTDSNDFDVAIADPYGETVQVGPYNTQLVASIGFGIQWILTNRASNPGIGEGDMFLCNDPWIGGGLHQNDVSLFAPIFFEGKLFGWTVAVAHQLDLGGVAPGSWTPRAQDVFWESLPTPPVRIVHNGVLQKDIEDVYLRRSRTPQMVGLDLRAKMGANFVGKERITALIERYGAQVVQAVMQRQMDDAERQLRAKLLACSDGEWTAESYQEQSMQGDRGLHAIRCRMTKAGSELTFDFTETDAQSGMINTTFCGMAGGVVAGIIPMLCGDIPWSIGGLMRCITIESKPGTLNDATFPAAVGKGSVASAWATTNTVMECLGKMLDCSVEHRHDAMGVCCGTWDLSVFAGLDQHGAPFANILFDPMGGGFGAGADHDGVDTGGLPIIPQGRMPDVEMNEFTMPLLYLWRREEIDSGGPGAYRGGLAGSLAVVPHRTSVSMTHVISGSGKAVPMNVGIAGGYPGNTQRDITIRNSKVASLLRAGLLPQTIDELDGDIEVRSCEEEGFLNPGDAHYMFWQAGGGYGDPLIRDPQTVEHDIRTFRVSDAAAREIYGVAIEDDTVDEAATEALRSTIRAGRRARTVRSPDGGLQDVRNSNIVVTDAGRSTCRHCGNDLGCSAEEAGRSLILCEGPVSLAGSQIETNARLYIDADVVFRQWCCGNCMTTFETRIVPATRIKETAS